MLEESVKEFLHQIFSIGKSKDLNSLRSIHDKMATKFNHTYPYHRMEYEEICLYEEMFFANVSDYEYNIRDLRIDMIDTDHAVVTFILEQKGIIVDDYSFTGRVMQDIARCTLVLRRDKESSRWVILHEHMSSYDMK